MPWDFSDAERKGDRLARSAAEMNVPMAAAQAIVEKRIDTNFESESAAGVAWAPLAPSTVEDRRRKGFGPEHPILQRTKELRGSMKGYSDNESAEVGPDEGLPYAGVHEHGSKDGKIPARPYLRIAAEDETAIEDEIWRHLMSQE